MFDEEKIDQLMGHSIGRTVDQMMKHAESLSHESEADAVAAFTLGLLASGTPDIALATFTAMLAVRWHRTKQLEETLSNPAPGQ